MDITRDKALALARQFVLELYPPVEDRRHPGTTTEMREMLSQILAIAEYLSGSATDVDETTLAQILEQVKSINSSML